MAKGGAAAAGVAALQPLDFALTLIGCRICPSSWLLVSIVNNLLLIAWLCVIVCSYYPEVVNMDQAEVVTYGLFFLATYAESIAYLLLSRVYRSKLRRLLQESWIHVCGSRRRRLWFISAAYACLWVSRAIAYTVKATKNISLSLVAFVFLVDVFEWIPTFALTCAFAMQLLSAAELSLTARIKDSITGQTMSATTARLLLHDMRRLKEQLLPAFGVFPCLAFLDPFFSTAVWLCTSTHGPPADVFEIGIFSIKMVSLLYLSFVADRCADAAADASEKLVALILRSKGGDREWQKVCQEARELALVPHEVCRGFPLSLSSFCSFLGALITVTALGVPMMRKMMKAEDEAWGVKHEAAIRAIESSNETLLPSAS